MAEVAAPRPVPTAKPLAEKLFREGSWRGVVDFSAARKTRRVALVAAGQAAADCSGFPGKKVLRPVLADVATSF
jgi:hypothetical protein